MVRNEPPPTVWPPCTAGAALAPEPEVTEAETPQERTSWWPRPLVAGGVIEPTILRRTDGEALFYPGRLHAVVGESESCKTWFVLMAVVAIVNELGHALIVDFEDVE